MFYHKIAFLVRAEYRNTIRELKNRIAELEGRNKYLEKRCANMRATNIRMRDKVRNLDPIIQILREIATPLKELIEKDKYRVMNKFKSISHIDDKLDIVEKLSYKTEKTISTARPEKFVVVK